MTAEAVALPTPDDRTGMALWFARRGFGIFPVWSTTDGHCRCPAGVTCGSPGKHPITANGFKDATTDERRIRTFLAAASEPNYGMFPPEGVFIWDVDTDPERARIATLEARHGPLPATLHIATANGEHVFLRWPEGYPRPVHKMFGLVTRWGTGAAQGYVVGPLSIHVTGKVYVPAPGTAQDIATLPETWAQAAVEPDTDTITVKAGGDPGSVQVGGRHDWLRDRARFYSGFIRDPDVLLTTMLAENAKLPVPKTREEVQRAIGDALVKFPADPVETDPETGEQRRVFGDELGMLEPRDDSDLFPGAPSRAAFDGPIGEAARHLATGTDASEVALLASLLAFCGALMPAHGYYHGMQTTSPFLALVGVTGDGRKGTAMNRAKDALGLVLGTATVNRLTIGGTASGEGLIRAMRDRGMAPTGLLFEAEYGRFLAAAGREGSTLDSIMRLAWDGETLANTKVSASDSMAVAMPYWLPAIVGITPDELRRKMPEGSEKSGSANRWLWLPVVRRDARVRSTEPFMPAELGERIVGAHRVAATPRRIERSDAVDDLLGEYDGYLRANSLGLAADMTRRYPTQAFRIALIHASSEASGTVEVEHVVRAIALTEYARAGLSWTFGDILGDRQSTLLLRHLQESGVLSATVISKHIIRDPIRRQDAVDDLIRLGLARRVVVATGGRNRTELRLVSRNRGFRDLFPLISLLAPETTSVPERDEARIDVQKGHAERAADRAEACIDVQKPPPEGATGEWLRPCLHYSDHQSEHRNTPEGWICLACDDVRDNLPESVT